MDCLTAKLVNHLTAMLVNRLTATLVNRLTAKLMNCLTAKLVVVNLVKLHLTKFKYAFNLIQNWQTDALQFHLMVLIFSYGGRR